MRNRHIFLRRRLNFFRFEAKCETTTFSPASNENEYERRTLLSPLRLHVPYHKIYEDFMLSLEIQLSYDRIF